MQDWIEWIRQAQEGSSDAFDQVVKRFDGMAIGYACSILGDFHLAQDAAQDAFIQAYCDLDTLQEPAAFPAWLRRMLFKHCDRILRKKKIKTVSLELSADIPDQDSNPLHSIEREETRQLVFSALNALPEKERVVIALFYIDGYSLNEMGEFLEVPVNTIKSRLFKARKKLRERMIGLMEDTFKQQTPGDDFSNRIRRILSGIERIHWETTSCLCSTGSIAACLRYLGEKVTNEEVMGISGGAFKLFWHPDWSPANCDLMLIGEEPVRRTFEAFGYHYTFVQNYERKNPAYTKDYYRKLILQSIDRNVPVIGIGIVGPPECCVISGYDREGDVLYGRSYFQGQHFGGDHYHIDSSGYYFTDQWYEHCYGLILIGDKTEVPPKNLTLRRSLEWAIELARLPEFDAILPDGGPLSSRHLNGLAAYDGIVEALERDSDYPADNQDALSLRLIALGNDGIHLLRAKRWYAIQYLKSVVTEECCATEALTHAINAYEQELNIVVQMSEIMPQCFSTPEKQQKILDPEFRRHLAAMLRDAKRFEEQAICYLEDAVRSY